MQKIKSALRSRVFASPPPTSSSQLSSSSSSSPSWSSWSKQASRCTHSFQPWNLVFSQLWAPEQSHLRWKTTKIGKQMSALATILEINWSSTCQIRCCAMWLCHLDVCNISACVCVWLCFVFCLWLCLVFCLCVCVSLFVWTPVCWAHEGVIVFVQCADLFGEHNGETWEGQVQPSDTLLSSSLPLSSSTLWPWSNMRHNLYHHE